MIFELPFISTVTVSASESCFISIVSICLLLRMLPCFFPRLL
jgi:hypothetical protein